MLVASYNAGLVRHSLTAAACAAVAVFGMMDANPSLYCCHQWLVWRGPAPDYQRHFANKTVWIVGASSGIGEELAYQISPFCGKLILSSRNVDRLQQVALNCRQRQQLTAKNNEPGQVVVLPMDVTSAAEELEEVIQNKLIPELPSAGQRPYLDCVIFNAGQGHQSKVQETKPETTLRMFQVNAIPPIILTQLLMHHQILAPANKGRKPQIVLTSSVGGRMGVPLSAAYAASKHALHGYAASLQAECSSWLRVDILCPGPIDTDFFQNQPNAPITSKGKSPLKMPVERLASLSMTHMVRRSNTGEEAWIAKQPTLLGMYLQQYVPSFWRWLLNQKVGPKRVSLYEQGLDLYDPASWKTKDSSRDTKEESHKTRTSQNVVDDDGNGRTKG
jgi:dehydrogenase/reductase SDR family member 7